MRRKSFGTAAIDYDFSFSKVLNVSVSRIFKENKLPESIDKKQ